MTDPNQYNPQSPQPAAQYNQPDYGQQAPQYGTPDYGQVPQYDAPAYGQPQYGQDPQYGQPQYGQAPQYGQDPQYAAANYGQPAPAPQPGGGFFDLTAPLDMPAYGCKMGEAIVRFFKKYAVFKGRASRSEFWWWFLANCIIVFLIGCFFSLLGMVIDSDAISTIDDLVSGLWSLAILVPTIALSVRRLHDINLRGTMLAIIYGIEFISLILLTGCIALICGGMVSVLSGDKNNLSAIGVIMLAVGVLAMLGSAIFYIVLMAKKSNPEGARFDNPNAAALPYPNGAATTNDPYAAQQQYAAQYNVGQQYGDAPQYDAPQQYAAPAAQQPAMPTAPAADPYAAQATQYDATPQQYAATEAPTAPAVQQPTMPPMPAVPTVPAVQTVPAMPPMPAMPQAPAQSQDAYWNAPADASTPVEPNTPVDPNAPTYGDAQQH